ncbi:MAG: XdhC family protein, partial [Geminicoccaceae bacterium]
MNRDILDRLLMARREKQPAALLRWLDRDRAQLLVSDEMETTLEAPLRAAVNETLRRDRGMTIETGEGAVFIQPFNPALRLIVVGAVHIAQSLVPMAALAGYEVTFVDPRRAFASDRRCPDVAVSQDWPDDALLALVPDARTAIVTLTHDPKLDDPALDVA